LQLPLPSPRTWGGRRAGAGPKLTPGRRPGVPHRARPVHIAAHPVQDDHLHLIVEADDSRALGRGFRGLAIRVARAVNRALGRRGAVWGDRYHARALTSPRAVRNALVYVLKNRQKHCGGERDLDPCSSARWFTGWRHAPPRPPGASPVVRARTWLAAVGWRRHGLVDLDERPRSRSRRPSRDNDAAAGRRSA